MEPSYNEIRNLVVIIMVENGYMKILWVSRQIMKVTKSAQKKISKKKSGLNEINE